MIFLCVPDEIIPPLPPLHSTTRFRQFTAKSRSVALLDQHIPQLLLECDWES